MSEPRTGRAGEFSVWYTHSRWRSLRARQLAAHPLCVFCEKHGRVELATVCDHITPHKGDRELFLSGPFQSLCKSCHDSTKKSMEAGKKSRMSIGLDGWPVMNPPGGRSTAVRT